MIPNARLCKALLDRITDRAHILETGTESYRFRRLSTNGRKERNRQKRSKAVQLPVRGKHGRPKLGFPSSHRLWKSGFPQSPQLPPLFISIRSRLNSQTFNRQQIGWAKINCRSGPNSVAKRKRQVFRELSVKSPCKLPATKL